MFFTRKKEIVEDKNYKEVLKSLELALSKLVVMEKEIDTIKARLRSKIYKVPKETEGSEYEDTEEESGFLGSDGKVIKGYKR